jgi:hypothetical protein
MKRFLLVLTLALVAAPVAGAGGWATVSLSSLPPGGLAPDDKWPVDITVLQHGETPLAGVTPVVTVRDGGGNAVGRFTATPTGKTGVYHAVVQFPATGTYRYEVYDGFETYGQARTHTFAPVEIGPAGTEFPYEAVAIGLLLALALGLGILTLRRGRAPEPAEVISLREAA